MASVVKSVTSSQISSTCGLFISRFFSSHTVPTTKMTGRPLVLCGPSGVGKSTIIKRLETEFPDAFGFSVSHTTRQPREGEVDGVSYHYVDKETIDEMIQNDEFIEHATFSNNTYGTSKAAVKTVVEQGKICILDIDTQGVIQIKKTDLNPLFVFIKPPSMEELERRLRGRQTETEESIQRRLGVAAREIEYGDTPGNFDLIIVNDDVEAAGDKIKEFISPHVEALQEQEEK